MKKLITQIESECEP